MELSTTLPFLIKGLNPHSGIRSKVLDTLLFFSSIHQYLLISISTFISNKDQSFQSNRSLISSVLLTTGTIQNYKKSKTQKVKVAQIYCAATFTEKYTKNLQ